VPYLSALEVRSPLGAIQIHVYLYLYLYSYSVIVIMAILHGRETWTLLTSEKRKLKAFHINWQLWILGLRWYHCVNNILLPTRLLKTVYVVGCEVGDWLFLGQWRSKTFGRLVRWSNLPPYCLRFWKIDSLFKASRTNAWSNMRYQQYPN